MLHNTFLLQFSRSFASDVIRRSIMTSRKARRFRAIFARNFLKIHTFFMNYWYFSELSCDKKNLKWIIISHGIYENSFCVFISPRQRLGDIKPHYSFHKYHMKWKIHFRSYIYIDWLPYIYNSGQILSQPMVSWPPGWQKHFCIII